MMTYIYLYVSVAGEQGKAPMTQTEPDPDSEARKNQMGLSKNRAPHSIHECRLLNPMKSPLVSGFKHHFLIPSRDNPNPIDFHTFQDGYCITKQ